MIPGGCFSVYYIKYSIGCLSNDTKQKYFLKKSKSSISVKNKILKNREILKNAVRNMIKNFFEVDKM